ncbi:hypothetical protein RIB2604_02501100 [Aspergillus luchuensis]|uniref:Uncharacterized protein n=1 Tax=Aspergillus kawachii TaxID=1069201 RepID=A0A146FQP7_ASPKA|nr:hypothetical protein RIB2604_02501100 [Aspergillus luchuensis]
MEGDDIDDIINWSGGADKGKSPPEPQTHEISAADIARGGKKGLIKLLKLDGDSEWREWLQLDFVKPYWLELWQHLSKVGDTERGTGLARVQETLIRGEARGNTKYSRRHVDKTNWDINDHMAYFLYNVRTENLSRRDGVFHRLGLHTGEMEAAVWALKNILVKCTVPRRSRSQAVGLRFSPTIEDYNRIALHEKWSDAQEYQCDNEDEACANLGIKKENPQLGGMIRGTALVFWQPVCINRIMETMTLGLVLGAIIADVVGVGKTWEAVGFLLYWVDEISSITDSFNIPLYYGDGRRQGAEFIKDKLTRKHSIFTGGIESARTIIITSYQTLESRHGPQAVKAWCAKTKHEYDPSSPRMPISFPHDLSGLFGIAVFDEAHMLRNPLSGLSLACAWLNAGFGLLLTATQFYNGWTLRRLGAMCAAAGWQPADQADYDDDENDFLPEKLVEMCTPISQRTGTSQKQETKQAYFKDVIEDAVNSWNLHCGH